MQLKLKVLLNAVLWEMKVLLDVISTAITPSVLENA